MHTPIDPTVSELVERLDQNQREMFEERAGQRQFSAGFSREYAEALALADVLVRFPEALSDGCVFAVDDDGDPRFYATTSEELLREHAEKFGAVVGARRSIAWAIDQEFGGLAELVVAA